MSVPHIHAFIDESGQDTRGRLFIVSIVFSNDWDSLYTLCEYHEQHSGKGIIKWGKAEHNRRMKYMRGILKDSEFSADLTYTIYRDTVKHKECILDAVVKCCNQLHPDAEFTINIDGRMTKSNSRSMATKLRRKGLKIKRVRGVARDENHANIRLADALAGFSRDAVQGSEEQIKLYQWAIENQKIVEVE